jgi:hypothetical protein
MVMVRVWVCRIALMCCNRLSHKRSLALLICEAHHVESVANVSLSLLSVRGTNATIP